MAKTRAQRKEEQRRRREAQQSGASSSQAESRAQRRTQLPESAEVAEAKLAEQGVDVPAPVAEPEAPAPSRADVGRPDQADGADEPGDRISRRAAKREERDRRARAKESERRRAPKVAAPERKKRGGAIGFFQSCWAELKKVQWPDRETLVQASGVTVLFIAIAAAYLGALDALFNFLVQHLL